MSTPEWDINQSKALYSIEHWSGGYFDVNNKGEIQVTPIPSRPAISLYELAQNFTAHGLSLPVLVRFPNILHHRVYTIREAFARAIAENKYQGEYTAVYPIKVNQQHHVVKEIMNAGVNGGVGLEAGSKSELMAVLALAPLQGGTVICNGYKDREYIRLALIGQQIGLHPYLVIEKASELQMIIEESRSMGIVPRIGVRIRLASVGTGKWQNSGGEKSKFGLSAAKLLDVIQAIKDEGLIESLQLMHFHLGSQVGNIRELQKALQEAARCYAELLAIGVPIQVVDVGGGLGVDYDGTRSRHSCSINYSVQEYANNVVYELKKISELHNLPHPNIISESGRAMTAHHAVLIVNVNDIEPAPGLTAPPPVADDAPTILKDMAENLKTINQRSAIEVYHDAIYWLNEAHTLFTHGIINLAQRAHAEQLYYAICRQVREMLQAGSRTHREILDELNDKLADKYFCNFSLFQSVPDAWAIDQLFPIVPLHRLDECPDRRATLQDLTCDSDGQFDRYVDGAGVETSMPVHIPREDEPYLLGVFLVGAYQEILGDMHNLFGDTFSVNVYVTEDGGYELVNPMEGDTVQEMLRYVNFDTDFLRNTYRKRLQAAAITPEQRAAYQREIDSGLVGYTYLET
ncbi:biosynthetic arginine decarboxylase [Beggiatoa leptomitoformis]|uniref:Biosynthetic arginine decarboxylase n=1 Tax=Beggiatoa leptomitoformis TaxID=288004 RepID=A0A2N9YJ90_9GAMM|nr:biosynthetic arginine decarboxylase [Beggiatoa leptomitoformis]ALG69303.1 biosynthetic arginine decarboxylase [Beggiatoa leptomitoformis]AUI70509.1 biosynthetic arginine decarboxylase [Beggiatoa leptomitoformis]